MKQKFDKYFFLFLIGDFLLFYIALSIVLFTRKDHWDSLSYQYLSFLPAFIIYEVVLSVSGVLDRSFVPSPKRVFDLLLKAQIVATILISVYFYLGHIVIGNNMINPATILALFSVLLFPLLYTWKIYRARIFRIVPIQALLIGSDAEVEEKFRLSPFWDMRIVEKIPIDASQQKITQTLSEKHINAVIVDLEQYLQLDMLYTLLAKNIRILNLVTLKEELTQKVEIDRINVLWFINTICRQESYLVSLLKRTLDLLLAIPVLLLYVLLLPILSFIITRDGGHVFFDMPRVGKGGRIFILRKFRSMSNQHDLAKEQTCEYKDQITKIGAFIRKTSLDELPQVISVIKGEMSFIGPRPEIPDLVQQYEKEIEHYQIRHLVKPGLSGWAQVKQISAPHHTKDVALTHEKLSYDLFYIKNHSIFLYLIVVVQTIKSLMTRTNHS